MPRNNGSVACRFNKKLVVPQPYGAAEQLFSDAFNYRVKHQIVKRFRDPPGPERVKEHSVSSGFIEVIFVKKRIARLLRPHQQLEVFLKQEDLVAIQNVDWGQIAVFTKEFMLVRRNVQGLVDRKEIGDRSTEFG